MTLPKDAGYRISATPLFSSDACRATSGTQLEVAPGSWLAVVSAPGFETQRVPFVVPRRGAVDVVASLRPVGSTPRGFVHVPAGCVQRTTRARKRGGLTELGPRSVGAFDIMEREVLLAEFLQYLNDPETSEEAREAILARPVGHGDRESGVWPFVRKLANGSLGASMVKGILPVNGVSYRDAQAYAAWLTRKARKRGQKVVFELPTELELMRAACGPDGRPYAYGAWFSPAWQKGAGARPYVFAEPPQSFPIDESMFGVYDLTGSLAEWCTRSDTPVSNQNQVVFGGSFTAWVVPSLSTTTGFDADAADATFGFRLASHPERAESR
jgi:formylglycine-generating enzyme required for sulfatase activity